jgi:hypothetical protein
VRAPEKSLAIAAAQCGNEGQIGVILICSWFLKSHQVCLLWIEMEFLRKMRRFQLEEESKGSSVE